MTDTAKQQSTFPDGEPIVYCTTCGNLINPYRGDHVEAHGHRAAYPSESSGITADETDSLGRPTIESLLEVQADLRAEIDRLETEWVRAIKRIAKLEAGLSVARKHAYDYCEEGLRLSCWAALREAIDAALIDETIHD